MAADVKGQSVNVRGGGQSRLRAARVTETEVRLVIAAEQLFLEQGYVTTTLAQVAERAGLAPRTVYVRFATKAALFRRIVDRALAGDADDLSLAERPGWDLATGAATLPERIAALVDLATGTFQRAGGLFEVAAQAEGSEPEIAAAARAGRQSLAASCREFWSRAQADGLIDAGHDVDALGVTTDILLCADTVVHLRRVHAWSVEQYRSHLTAVIHQLTPSRRPPAGTRP